MVSKTILLLLVALFMFPVCIGIGAAVFGIFAGLTGAVFGIISGILGAIFGLIGSIFGGLFNWHWNVCTIAVLVLIVALITRSRKL